MQVNPYLNFNGQCEAAFKFYEQSLGGKIVAMMTHAGTPMEAQTPAGWHDKILHACISVGETMIMGSDAPPEHYEKPQGFSVSLTVADAAEFQQPSSPAWHRRPTSRRRLRWPSQRVCQPGGPSPLRPRCPPSAAKAR